MDFIDYVTTYAKNELKITNFDQAELGNIMLQFLEESAKITNNDTQSMKQLVKVLERLVEQSPISPITEDDFVEEVYREGDQTIRIWRCTRYKYLYKTEDGRYWDDRAVAYRLENGAESDRLYLYQGQLSSKKEVSLPYYPNTVVNTVKLSDVNNI